MMIHIDNYELYVVDYIDGTLDADAKTEMDQFLEHHPEIYQELNAMAEPITMEPNMAIVFEDKAVLLKDTQKFILAPFWKWSVAASIAIVLALFVWMGTNSNDALPQEELAEINEFNPSEEDNLIDLDGSSITLNEVADEDTGVNTIINKSPSIAINKPPQENIKVRQVNVAPINNQHLAGVNQKDPALKLNETQISEINVSASQEVNVPIIESEQINKREPIAQLTSLDLKNEIIDFKKEKTVLPINLIADYKAEAKADKNKSNWFIDAVTKKSDGSKVFAFEGVKRALTPTRYRDVKVDKASPNSPIKQLTND